MGFAGGPLWIVFIPFAAFLVIYTYALTRPNPIPSFRYFLTCLRVTVISLALLTLAEPTVSVLNQKFVKPTLSVLVDRSRSMAVVESGSTRIEKVSALLQDVQFQQYLDNASVTLDYVADTVQQVGVETLYVFGNATNLAEGIRNVPSDSLFAEKLGRYWSYRMVHTTSEKIQSVLPRRWESRFIHSALAVQKPRRICVSSGPRRPRLPI